MTPEEKEDLARALFAIADALDLIWRGKSDYLRPDIDEIDRIARKYGYDDKNQMERTFTVR